ncbi:MAG TPA: hypothetical protein VK854_09200, partial [Woeseiaceae bacterium]|nr:hypothetical protein [Woeseiaceae bacterium]
PAIALLWLGFPALAAPIPANGLILPPEISHQSDVTRDVGPPSIVFAKKNDKGGGGGPANAGQGKGKGKDDNGNKNDEDDKDIKKDEGGKKDTKDEGGKKDTKDEGGKKDERDHDGGDSGERDEQEPDDDQGDHDRNERHDHDNGKADDRHDHENENDEEQDHHGGEEPGEEDASSAATADGTVAKAEDTSGAESGEAAQTDGAEPASSMVPGVVTLSWTPPTENEDGSPLLDLAGYRIYWRDTSGTSANSMQIDNPGVSTAVIENLAAGTYEFAMSSVNAAGIESARSNTITRVVEFGAEPVATMKDEAISDPTPHLMISGTPPEAVSAGHLYLFTPGIESNADTPPVFMIDGLPHWAGFDEITGELYGTPDDAHIGLYEAITISATDGVVVTSLPAFSIEVVAAGAAPGTVTLSWMPPTENEDGSYLVDLAGYWIYWGNNPGQYTEWMKIDSPGLTTVVIEDLVPGAWEFAMTSFNAAGVESNLSNAVTRFVN